MSNRSLLLALLALAACGDNVPRSNLPPEPRSSTIVVTVPEDGSVQLDATATDPEGLTVTYSRTEPAHGTLSGDGPLYRYTPAADYDGADAFQVTASDGVLTATIAVTITVTGVNDAPVATAQQVATPEGTPLAITLTGSDAERAALAFSVMTQPAHGTLSGAPPNLTYTPELRYTGSDAFTFTVSDGALGSQTATISIAVSDVITCGDGIVEGAEACDDGNDVDTDACRNSCVSASCGDGTIQAAVEECDDGNDVDTDACRNSCVNASCGDGVVQAGAEECDDGNLDSGDACLATCALARCGDGVVQAGVEQCDDGNLDSGDACVATCALARCGDGVVQAGVEQCDDGNAIDTDACRNSCQSASCGDSVVRDGVEQCDDGNAIDTDACLTSCAAASCGDGLVEAGVEECDDGNLADGDACRADCTIPVCGDGLVDAGEECDDGGTADDDGCGHSCRVERCGDGLVQLARGETCDDGNTTAGDGCDAVCHTEPFLTVAPVKISGSLACTTAVANAARKVAVDGSGNIYAVMQCGTAAYAVSSVDRGHTYSAPQDLSTELGTPDNPAVISQVAVGNGPSRVAYAALMLNNGQVYLRVTEDAGATWGAATLLGQATSTSTGLSLQSFNDNIYVGFTVSGGVAVVRNGSRGAGLFETTAVGMSIAFFDLLYDIAQGTLALVADTPAFHVRVSNDGGVTFASEVNPPGQEYYSDWAIGNGKIFVSGTNLGSSGDSNSVYVIPSNNPTTSTRIFGLPAISTAQTRTLAADAAGNAFFGSRLDSGGIQLDRLGAGATAFDAPRPIVMSGSAPVVSGLPSNDGAAMVYTAGTEVWATIQAY